MAKSTLQVNPISITINEDTIARPFMRLAPSITANSALTQVAKPGELVSAAPSVKILWNDGTPATSNEKFTIQVTFLVRSGGGNINSNLTTVTVQPNAQGIATLQNWKLGNLAGENTVEASAVIIGAGDDTIKRYSVGGGTQPLSGGPITFKATSDAGIASLTIQPTTSTIVVQDTAALQGILVLEPGASAASWSWVSNDASIATVTGNSKDAVVTGIKVGTATITATVVSGNSRRSATATVTVVETPPTPSISLTATPTTIAVVANGSTATTAITIGRTNYTNKNVSLSSTGYITGLTGVITPPSTTSNTATLTVTAAVGTVAGTYPITINGSGADVNPATTIVNVTVTAPFADIDPVCKITRVTIAPNMPVTMQVNETVNVTGTAEGTNCTSEQLRVRYSSSNTTIATVSTEGVVTAKAYGSAVITATSITDGTKSASVTITVAEPAAPPPPTPPDTTWRSCDGESHSGTPPTGWISATYQGEGNGICWEPISDVGFIPDLNTALLFRYQRDSGNLPEPITIKAFNKQLAVAYRLTLTTNSEIEIIPSTFTIPAQGFQTFTVKVTKPLLDKLADGTSNIGLNIDIQQV